MARTTRPLTNTEVKNAKPREREYNLSDGGGLALRVKPAGSKIWIFNYQRPHTKKRTAISLGAYPAVSLSEARRQRDEYRKLLAQDIDPKIHRDEAKQKLNDNTLFNVARRWHDIKKKSVDDNHAKKIWRSFELHVFPRLGEIPVDKISASQMIATLEPLTAADTLETVKRVCQRINEVMTFAVNTGIIEHNKLSGIAQAFAKPQKKHLPALPPERLPDLMKALNSASILKTTRCLIEWQLRTMVRASEAAGTRWDEIDFDKKTWTVPAHRMKGKKTHVVPLPEQCISLLNIMKTISNNSDYVFPGARNRSKSVSSQTANTAIKRMGFENDLVSHGMRSIASTTLNERGFDADVIEAALAHVGSDQVRNAYNRTDYFERRKELMKTWNDIVDEAATGNMSISSSKT